MIQINISTVKLIKRFLLILVDTHIIGNGECNEIITQLRYISEKSEYKPDIKPKLLTQTEVSEILGLSLSNFKKLEKQGAFPFKRKLVGSSVRYRNISVFEYINQE